MSNLALPASTTYRHPSSGVRMISPNQTKCKRQTLLLQPRSSVATCKPIRVQENLSRKLHAIPCDGDNNGNYWGNGEGGGGSGCGGDGEGEGDEEEEGFEGNDVLPMQHLNWPSDRQRKDQQPGWYLEVELDGSLFKVLLDGFDEVDIFSGKNAAEEQKCEEKMLKEMEIAANMMDPGNFDFSDDVHRGDPVEAVVAPQGQGLESVSVGEAASNIVQSGTGPSGSTPADSTPTNSTHSGSKRKRTSWLHRNLLLVQLKECWMTRGAD